MRTNWSSRTSGSSIQKNDTHAAIVCRMVMVLRQRIMHTMRFSVGAIHALYSGVECVTCMRQPFQINWRRIKSFVLFAPPFPLLPFIVCVCVCMCRIRYSSRFIRCVLDDARDSTSTAAALTTTFRHVLLWVVGRATKDYEPFTCVVHRRLNTHTHTRIQPTSAAQHIIRYGIWLFYFIAWDSIQTVQHPHRHTRATFRRRNFYSTSLSLFSFALFSSLLLFITFCKTYAAIRMDTNLNCLWSCTRSAHPLIRVWTCVCVCV